MTQTTPDQTTHRTTRRTVVKGAAWAVPAVTMGTVAPRLAASVRKDPGINGWVRNTPNNILGICRYTLEVDSTPSGSGPDGAPFGLYLYDVLPNAVITQAKLVYWIIGNQSASWTTLNGHGACWSGPVRGTPSTKADGFLYTPYTWTYNCPILPSQVSTDGRLRLNNFHVRATFTQPNDRCDDITYWTQRFVTIDQYGNGNPEVMTFERRNGTKGPFSGSARMAAPKDAAEGTTHQITAT